MYIKVAGTPSMRHTAGFLYFGGGRGNGGVLTLGPTGALGLLSPVSSKDDAFKGDRAQLILWRCSPATPNKYKMGDPSFHCKKGVRD